MRIIHTCLKGLHTPAHHLTINTSTTTPPTLLLNHLNQPLLLNTPLQDTQQAALPLPTLSHLTFMSYRPHPLLAILIEAATTCFYSHLESPFNPHLPDPHVNISPTQKETHMQQEAKRNTETATQSIGKPHRNPI
jgi:hypothetical protein